jgi:hypothetical protein
VQELSKGVITYIQEIKSAVYSWNFTPSNLQYIVSKGMVHRPQISSIVLICSGECLTNDLGSG